MGRVEKGGSVLTPPPPPHPLFPVFVQTITMHTPFVLHAFCVESGQYRFSLFHSIAWSYPVLSISCYEHPGIRTPCIYYIKSGHFVVCPIIIQKPHPEIGRLFTFQLCLPAKLKDIHTNWGVSMFFASTAYLACSSAWRECVCVCVVYRAGFAF